MERPKRWLWPTSESRILQHENYWYGELQYGSLAQKPCDVLAPGSEDELDGDGIQRKRRRIMKLARSHLEGRQLYISSAQLKGPSSEEQPIKDKKSIRSALNDQNKGAIPNKPTIQQRLLQARDGKLSVNMGRISVVEADRGTPSPSPTEMVQTMKRQRMARKKTIPERRMKSFQRRSEVTQALGECSFGRPDGAALRNNTMSKVDEENITRVLSPTIEEIHGSRRGQITLDDEPAKDNDESSHSAVSASAATRPLTTRSGSESSQDDGDKSHSVHTSPTSTQSNPADDGQAAQSGKETVRPGDLMADDLNIVARNISGDGDSNSTCEGLARAKALSQQALSQASERFGINQAAALSNQAMAQLMVQGGNDKGPCNGDSQGPDITEIENVLRLGGEPDYTTSRADDAPPITGFTAINQAGGTTDETRENSTTRELDSTAVNEDSWATVRQAAQDCVAQPAAISRPRHKLPVINKLNRLSITNSRDITRELGTAGGPEASKASISRHYQAAPHNMSSPFLFRKPGLSQDSGDNLDEPQKHPRLVLFESFDGKTDLSKGTERAAAVQTAAPPALNLSFDQDTFGMNFDLIDQYTNSRLPSTEKSGANTPSVARKLRRAMRASGASISRHTNASDSSQADPESPLKTSRGDRVGNPRPGNSVVALDAPAELSTQAALQEAHLALCDLVSPEKLQVQASVRDSTPEPTPRSPVCAITPFAEFHRDLSPVKDSVRVPELSTQAMFDAFSPFPVSEIKRPRHGKQTSFASFEAVGSTKKFGRSVVPSSLAKVVNDAEQTAQEKQQVAFPSLEGGWSFDVLDKSPAQRPAPASRQGSSQHSEANFDQVLNKTAGTGPKRGNQSEVSSSGRALLVQHLSKPSSTQAGLRTSSEMASEAQRPLAQLTSFRLSEIFDSVKDYRHRDLDLKTLLSQESARSSVRDTQLSAKQRGKVVDHDAASTTSESSDGPSPEKDASARLPISVTKRRASRDLLEDTTIVPTSPSSSRAKSSLHLSQSLLLDHSGLLAPSAPTSTARGALQSHTTRSSFQDAQREGSLDIDGAINDLQRDVLGSWDVERAMRRSGMPG